MLTSNKKLMYSCQSYCKNKVAPFFDSYSTILISVSMLYCQRNMQTYNDPMVSNFIMTEDHMTLYAHTSVCTKHHCATCNQLHTSQAD